MGEKNSEKNQNAKPLSLTATTAITGFVGGLFWGAIALFAHFFKFSEISPNTVLEPWTVGAWKSGWLGIVISLLLLGILGIGAAFLYYFTLKQFNNIWTGLLYGAILFVIVFYVLNPLFPSLNHVSELKFNTIVTMICIYLLFGLFVGYSISYEYKQQLEREKQEEMEKSSSP